MCAKNTKTNKDSSESRIETLYALLLDLLRAVLALGYLGNDSNYGAGVLLSRDRQSSGVEGWLPWQQHQHLNDFLSQQVGDLMSSLLNSKGKLESG